jgi:hypothetical protein
MHVPVPDPVELPRILRRALVGCVSAGVRAVLFLTSHAMLFYDACNCYVTGLVASGDAGMDAYFDSGAE